MPTAHAPSPGGRVTTARAGVALLVVAMAAALTSAVGSASSQHAVGVWAAEAVAQSPLEELAGPESSGTGVDVALIDTGVEPVTGLDAPARLITVPQSDISGVAHVGPGDEFGHGTVMAGIIAGEDHGVAQNARIVDLRVADETGFAVSQQLARRLDWLVENGRQDGLDVRIALIAFDDGATGDSGRALLDAIDRAWAAGIVVVVASGDATGSEHTLTGPARSPNAIVVAATQDGAPAAWSRLGDPSRWADVAAPGDRLLAPIHAEAEIATAAPHALFDVDGRTAIRGRGSSHAAAVVAGVVARMLEERPDLTPTEIRAELRRIAPPVRPSWSSNSWSSNSWSSNSWSSNSWS